MKYSKNFERDYNWYLKYKNVFTFSGSPKKEIKQGNKYTAKEAFYLYDTQGKVVDTTEPELLKQIFKCKESINFQIKQWSEARAEETLYDFELNNTIDDKLRVLEWVNEKPVYFKDMKSQYELLDWMAEAVEKQKYKYYDNRHKR